ncbi:MAG: hypothetical protein ACM33T_06060 [Solirubrobacterales bacterium]
MSKRLSEADISAICELIDGWRGPLTWESLVDGVEGLLGKRYSRQALHAHERVHEAYRVRKNILRNMPESAPRGSVEIKCAQDRIDRLEAENARLRAENDRLLAQFATWAYNAHLAGLTPERLNNPLPPTDRDRTRITTIRR